MAFQITDDILDFTGTVEELGKPVGSDLRQGNITLPALYALHHSKDKERIAELINSDNHNRTEDLIEIIRKSEGIEYSKELAKIYFKKAKDALLQLPAVNERKTLLEISDFLSERTY